MARALDVNVVSEEGMRAEMGDEDDDLLRAAEELGIDLSGVRAGGGEEAADEAEEQTVDEGDAGARTTPFCHNARSATRAAAQPRRASHVAAGVSGAGQEQRCGRALLRA